MFKLLVILGPTSTGKTDLAIRLAREFNGELVACDSRQVYVGLDIGTGKLPSGRWKMEDKRSLRSNDLGRWKKGKGFWEMDGIKIWMYDVADPKKQYTVFDYVKDVRGVIDDIWEIRKLPIIVGGTGLYLKALLEGLPNLAIPVDKNLRKKLEKLSKEELQKRLQEISPDKWKSLNESDKQNSRRLVRAIEIATSSVVPDPRNDKERACNDILKIGLIASREILYKRIDERVVNRIDQGMIDEARKLHKSGLSFKRMRQLGLEYGVLADFLEGAVKTEDEVIKIMQGKIHGYARRQITWFKKEENILWFDISHKNYADKVENLAAKWYDSRVYAAKD